MIIKKMRISQTQVEPLLRKMSNLCFASIFLMLVAIFAASCSEKDKTIPAGYVDFWLDINLPQYSKLKTPGNLLLVGNEVNGSNNTPNGVILYRLNDEINAYDNRCTNHRDKSVALDITTDAVLLTCPDCGSQFIITDGTVTKRPASAPLLQYNTNFDGSILRVYN